MHFRFGKPCDAKRLAEIHSKIKDVNSLGIFVLMGKTFLRKYYSIVLSDPYSYILCAINDKGIIVGYSFNLIDNGKHHKYLYGHKIELICSALSTILIKPYLLKELYRRYKSLKKNDGVYASKSGARGGYWGWDPDFKDAFSALELRERMNEITIALGIKVIHFEVDNDNANVYKFHLLNGAIIDQVVTLPDGRRRTLMHYNCDKNNKRKPKI